MGIEINIYELWVIYGLCMGCYTYIYFLALSTERDQKLYPLKGTRQPSGDEHASAQVQVSIFLGKVVNSCGARKEGRDQEQK